MTEHTVGVTLHTLIWGPVTLIAGESDTINSGALGSDERPQDAMSRTDALTPACEDSLGATLRQRLG